VSMENTIIVQGNEACVKGAIAAGCRFFAGYPITPATEIAELMSRDLPGVGGVFIQMEDELGSINSVIGAAWAGAKAMTATTGPGFSLMQEGIGYAAITETPCVIINVQRGGPGTGQPTMSAQQDVMQAKYGAHGDYETIAFCPASVQECFDMTVEAFNVSERFRIPAMVLSDEIVGHTREKLRIPEKVDATPRTAPQAKPGDYLMYRAEPGGLLDGMPSIGQGYNILVDSQTHDETGNRKGGDIKISGDLINRICYKVTNYIDQITDIEEQFCEDAELAVISYGSVSRSASHAVKLGREKGLKTGGLRLKVMWPFPDEALRKALPKVKRIVVPEMNVGKINREVERVFRSDVQVISMPRLGGAYHTPAEILAEMEAK
jgi:2-oxoglutarate ferredoxin oxidoreductase subunit alpha